MSWNPSRSGGRIFFSRVNSVCWLLFSLFSVPVLPQWHVKDPGPSAKSIGGRLYLNTHAPLTQSSQSGLTMLLSRHNVGTYPETSLHATCQGTFGHSHPTRWATLDWSWPKEWNQCIWPNFHFKKKRGAGGEWTVKHSPQILMNKEKATTTTSQTRVSLHR